METGTDPAAGTKALSSRLEDAGIADAGVLELAMGIFSILFVAPSPVSLHHIKAIMNIPEEVFEAAINKLKAILEDSTPLFLQEFDRFVCLKTRGEFAEYVTAFNNIQGQKTKLSEEALLTLAIIAYSQPVQKSAIDNIRGVDSEKTLETLKKYGLVTSTGRMEEPGAPILYVTTAKFLEQFGLKSLSELPEPSMSPGEMGKKVFSL